MIDADTRVQCHKTQQSNMYDLDTQYIPGIV